LLRMKYKERPWARPLSGICKVQKWATLHSLLVTDRSNGFYFAKSKYSKNWYLDDLNVYLSLSLWVSQAHQNFSSSIYCCLANAMIQLFPVIVVTLHTMTWRCSHHFMIKFKLGWLQTDCKMNCNYSFLNILYYFIWFTSQHHRGFKK